MGGTNRELAGPCTFENVKVVGTRLYCNGQRTIFTKDCEIQLSEALYGGGYRHDVDSTYVVLAASGSINQYATSGTHNVVGGSYQGSVKGSTYLEISGDIQFKGGNHITPGCVRGDGTSSDHKNSPDVSVGGNATLIYDNDNADTSPAIEGSYGCEMKGNVTLDVRAGRANEICGQYEFADKSIIRGDLHIIAGAEKYENTDRTLRLNGNWPITGAGYRFAASPFEKGTYQIDGNVVIDTYENVWGWDKYGTIGGDVPEIYGAIKSKVGGNITINAHGSHMENITGAWLSTVGDGTEGNGNIRIYAEDVELKYSYYETEYDEGDIYGLDDSTASGTVTICVDGGDVGLLLITTDETANAGSSIRITGQPKIRTGVLGTTAQTLNKGFPTAELSGCQADIPFIQAFTQTKLTERSKITVDEMELDYDLQVEKDSTLTTKDNQIHLWGDAVLDGTWE